MVFKKINIIYILFLLNTYKIFSIFDTNNYIPKVPIISITIDSDVNGYPILSAIKEFLLLTYYANKQQEMPDISIEEIKGGPCTAKIYKVYVYNKANCSIFFLKINNETRSTEKLVSLQEGFIGQKFHKKHTQIKNSPNFPSKYFPEIVWLLAVFRYQDQNNIIKDIEVTTEISSKNLWDILIEENEYLIEDSSYKTGIALSYFHQLFMKDIKNGLSICHKDFNVKNILYNSENKRIYFIDNGSIDNDFITQEIFYFLTHVFICDYLNQKNSRWNLYMIYSLSFLQGYIETYPHKDQKIIAELLKNYLEKKLEVFSKHIISLKKRFKVTEFKDHIFSYLNRFNN